MACTQDADLHLTKARRVAIFIFGITDIALYGGAVFGWPQLVYTLKTLRIYSNLCAISVSDLLTNLTIVAQDESKVEVVYSMVIAPESGQFVKNISQQMSSVIIQENYNYKECPDQDERFALLYTIAVLCYDIPAVAVGYLLHYAGLRTTRMFGCFLVASSFLCLSAATVEDPNWLFPSVALLAIAGSTLCLCGMQLGDLFPKKRSTATTLMIGSSAASASLFLVFSMFVEAEVSLFYICYFFAAISTISAVCSFMMPVHHIPYAMEIGLPTANVGKASLTSKTVPLKDSLCTLSSCLHFYWIFMGLFAISVYLQYYNVWVTASTSTMEETRTYTNWFSYSNLISVFIAPLGGAFTDYMVKRARKGTKCQIEYFAREIQANCVPLIVTTVLTIVMYGCLLFHHHIAIVVSLICMIVVRPCIIAISTTYIRIRFPSYHLTRLMGTYLTLACGLQFIQIPHFNWAQQSYHMTHIITLILLFGSFINPLHLMWTGYLRKVVKERDNLQ